MEEEQAKNIMNDNASLFLFLFCEILFFFVLLIFTMRAIAALSLHLHYNYLLLFVADNLLLLLQYTQKKNLSFILMCGSIGWQQGSDENK